ncbi:MAG: hypothetical protein WBD24_05530 [Candidatus Omnitrophota bacterium]
MGLKDRKKMTFKHKQERRKKRKKLIKKGLDPGEFFFGRFYVGHKGSTVKE